MHQRLAGVHIAHHDDDAEQLALGVEQVDDDDLKRQLGSDHLGERLEHRHSPASRRRGAGDRQQAPEMARDRGVMLVAVRTRGRRGNLTRGGDHAVAAGSLGFVQCRVRAREQFLERTVAACDPDRDRQQARFALRVWDVGMLDCRADPLGDRDRPLGVGVAQDQQEFLASEPVGRVGGAQRAARGGGDQPQRLIARQVPEPVVVGLEVVDVADGDRDLLTVFALQRLVHRPVVRQRAPVADPGERVAP